MTASETYRRLEFVLSAAEEGRRVGRLVTALAGVSRHGYAQLRREEGVLLDGRYARADERAHAGQVLTVLLPCGPEEDEIRPGPYAVWADGDLLVIDKPAPLPVMRSPGKGGPSLEELLSGDGRVFRPVNRLDKGTSGLMLCAVNAYSQHRLQALLHTEKFVREYLAVTEGVWSGEGTIDLPIAKAPGSAVRRTVDPAGKPCLTRYRTLSCGCGRTLVRLRLETGRTHQIRVHLAALGHPVAGDYLYGEALPGLPGRFALHSAYVSFMHPVTGQALSFESPLPEALEALLREDQNKI